MNNNRRWARPLRAAIQWGTSAGCVAMLAACATKAPETKSTGGWLKDQVADAYTFGFPLVASDLARERSASATGGEPGVAPLNTLRHSTALPPVGAQGFPSVDTLDSTAWLDVTGGPVVVSLPAAPRGRYYDARAFDTWTNVLYSSAESTPYPKAQTIAFVSAGWKGDLPAGAARIETPTRYVWLSIRVRVHAPHDERDMREISKLRAAMRIEAASAPKAGGAAAAPVVTGAWASTATDQAAVAAAPEAPAGNATPGEQAEKLDASAFFGRLARALDDNPPAPDDAHAVSELADLGVKAGEPVQFKKSDAGLLASGLADGRERLATVPANALTKNGWIWFGDGAGNYGTDYTLRAFLARRQPGTGTKESEVKPVARVDSDDHPLNGANTYVLHFAPNQLPPVRGFWSITAYAKDGTLAATKLPRLSITERDALKRNRDGSVDVIVSQTSPGKGRVANWLPTPGGEFQLTMRLYAPKPAASDGSWAPPVVQRK
jgi:hypothetical protein